MEKQFNIAQLTNLIFKHCPDVLFAYLFGSAQSGIIKANSDIDIAVYLSNINEKTKTLLKITELVENLLGNIPVDVVFLNHANCILAFEAIKGKRLFVRDGASEIMSGFYSLTCREYESETYRRKKQLEYRNYEVQWNN